MKLAYKVSMYNYFKWLIFSILYILFFAKCNSRKFVSSSIPSIFLILLSPMSSTSSDFRLFRFCIFFILFADKNSFFNYNNPSRAPSGTSFITLNARSRITKFLRWFRFSSFEIRLSYNSSSINSVHYSMPSILVIKFFLKPNF